MRFCLLLLLLTTIAFPISSSFLLFHRIHRSLTYTQLRPFLVPGFRHLQAKSRLSLSSSLVSPRLALAMTDSNNPPPQSREELRRLRLAMFDKGNENQEPTPKRLKTKTMVQEPEQVVDLIASSSDELEDDAAGVTKASAARASKQTALKKPPPPPKKKSERLKDKEVVDLLWDSSDDDKKQSNKAAASKTTAKNTKAPIKSLTQSSSSESTGLEATFQAATYNLWFGPRRDGSPHAEQRMQAVADLLLARTDPPLYFAAFQELTHSLDEALFPLLESAGYRIIRQPLDHPMFLPYGVALAVHQSLTFLDGSWKPYRYTKMDRGFVFARCHLPNGLTCVVTSTHLESFNGKDDNGSPVRQNQLLEMEEFCNKHIEEKTADLAIMMGDLNWDDARKNPDDPVLDDVLTSVEWKDAWLETNHLRSTVDAKKGFTYDPKLNPMLGGSLRRRFDRCLIRKARHIQTNLVSTALVGTESLPGLSHQKTNPYNNSVRTVPTAPSDHFCVVTQIQTCSSGKTLKG